MGQSEVTTNPFYDNYLDAWAVRCGFFKVSFVSCTNAHVLLIWLKKECSVCRDEDPKLRQGVHNDFEPVKPIQNKNPAFRIVGRTLVINKTHTQMLNYLTRNTVSIGTSDVQEPTRKRSDRYIHPPICH
jgi:hypothetical protein